jgi:hypothetical protein
MGKVAPLPFAEVIESPIMFTAMILAMTLDELPSEKGAARNTVTGIVHVLIDLTGSFEPLQFVLSCSQVTPSLARI